MAEQLLNDAKVSPMFQEVRRKAVPHHVRCDIPGKSRTSNPTFDAQPHGYGGESGASLRQKNVSGRPFVYQGRPTHRQVPLQGGDAGATNRYDPFFVSFTDNANKSRV
jgi:hypothetical protein